MIRETGNLSRFFSLFLCVGLLVSCMPAQVKAQRHSHITVQIGQPAVWSMNQAHYLLANMHDETGKVKSVKLDDLDPNETNASRLEFLRTFFGVQASYDQIRATEDRIKLNDYQQELAQQQKAQTQREAKIAERDVLADDLRRIDKQLAALTEEKNKLNGNPTPSPADKERVMQIDAELNALNREKAAKTSKKADLQADIDGLKGEAEKDVKPPTLSPSPFTNEQGKLPDLSFNDKAVLDPTVKAEFIKKFLGTQSNLGAQIKLDNHINMQYEIIAKQLTLLRDEVSPDERVIFLELPSSIYSVDEESNDYIVQVEWKIEGYSDTEKTSTSPTTESYALAVTQKSRAEKRNEVLTLDNIATPEKPVQQNGKLKVRTLDIIPRQSALNVNSFHATVKQKSFLALFNFLIGFAGKVEYQRQKELYDQFIQQELFASGYGKGRETFGWTFGPMPGTRRIAPGQRTTYAVLAVPRQALSLKLTASAKAFKKDDSPKEKDLVTTASLKITEATIDELRKERIEEIKREADESRRKLSPDDAQKLDEVKQKLAADLMALSADSLKVRRLLNQEFRSESELVSALYSAVENPQQAEQFKSLLLRFAQRDNSFVIAIPNERTAGFQVDSVNYVPVVPGEKATVILGGSFSPQLGILVNGKRLPHTTTIARPDLLPPPQTVKTTSGGNGGQGGAGEAAKDNSRVIQGEYEIVNSNEVIISFSMDSSFVGTPIITLTTPERTSPINFFPLTINYRNASQSLQELCTTEPMFTKPFLQTDAPVVRVLNNGANNHNYYLEVRLKGEGFRPTAEVWANDKRIPTRWKQVRKIMGQEMQSFIQVNPLLINYLEQLDKNGKPNREELDALIERFASVFSQEHIIQDDDFDNFQETLNEFLGKTHTGAVFTAQNKSDLETRLNGVTDYTIQKSTTSYFIRFHTTGVPGDKVFLHLRQTDRQNFQEKDFEFTLP